MVLLPGTPPNDPNQRPIYARSGWEIPQPHPSELQQKIPKHQDIAEVHRRTIDLVVNRRKKNKSNITIRSVSPHPYNCVGMIFASRRAFIEIDHIYDILRHDSFRPIQRHEIVVGDIVLYKLEGKPSHVALVVEIGLIGSTINLKVLSKWGIDGELEHLDDNVHASLGRPTEYYTERQAYETREFIRRS